MVAEDDNPPVSSRPTAVDRTVDRLTELPSLPTVLMEALAQIDRDAKDTGDIVDKIVQDPPLAARILRVVNSPFFGLPGQIDSVHYAVVLLGLSRIRELVITAYFRSLLPLPKGAFDYGRFWHHSLSVATCARMFAQNAPVKEETAFTAGLLHDIGRLAIGSYFPEEFRQILHDQSACSIGLLEAETRVLGMDHAEIGARLASRWCFPAPLREAIQQHHTPPESGGSSVLTTVVYAANRAIASVEESLGPAATVTAPTCDFAESPGVLRVLGMSLQDTMTVAGQAYAAGGQLAAAH